MNTSTLKQSFDNQRGVLTITGLDLSVLYINKQSKETTGYSPAEIIGKKQGKLWGGQMAPSFYKNLWNVIGIEKQPFVGTMQNSKKNGSTYWEQLYVAPILDDANVVKLFIEIKPPGVATTREHKNFAREFVSEFSHQKGNAAHIIDFIFESLIVDESEYQNEKPGSVADILLAFIQQTLLDPTSAVYRKRNADGQLVLNAQSDNKHFDILYTKYYPLIYKYLIHRLPDIEQAQDLTQELFIKAFKDLPNFVVSNASYSTYLLQIAHNVLSSYYRERRQSVSIDSSAYLQKAVSALPVDYARRFELTTMWHEVGNLSPLDQQVVQLKYKEDLTVKVISTIVHKSENAIKLVLSRARKKLRASLMRYEVLPTI